MISIQTTQTDTAVRAIGYVRVSTLEQTTSGLGLESQESRIRAYCVLKAMNLIEIVTDAGVSGGKPLESRPGGQLLLKSLKKHKAGAVVMLKLDRGFRDAADCLTVIDRWERSGVSLHIADLGGSAVDTTSAAGRFMLTVLAASAEMERNLIRERTKSALAVKKAKGERVGRVLFGFDLSADGVQLRPNESEQAVIANIQNMRAQGWTLRRIAADLNERGIPTKSGKARWAPQTVSRILNRQS